ncbi:MAG: GLPGLI family protein [Bacteroides pyogenes]|uniref:GLPGLI family protein n=1 Tax=Bacteroides TaxID=816 RepID=UPI0023F9D7ED|nr:MULTISPECIES: GLPGLI family protein [Bacteroides]MCI6213621.1 GLPGLI family protein [Bacteroides heparinolyticus]MCI7071781.1 GLPGLI family protein [Bacteroides pyogenes]MDY5353095.1 GLPGLI family protein [Bacteroides pyogenes]
MNRFLAIIILSFNMFLLNAQAIFIDDDGQHIPVEPQKVDNYITLDTAKVIVTYDVSIVNNLKNKEKKTRDIQVLQIGNKYSKTFSKLQYDGDSIYFSYLKKGARSAPWFQENIPPVEIYKNYAEKKTTVSHRFWGVRTVYLYRDDYPLKISWNLTGEKKEIHSYACQRAIGTFRGRTYEAWFTPEIPFKEGPYKFGELPGLILEINDMEKNFVYTCISITHPKQVVPIKFWKWKYQEIDRKKLFNMLKRAYTNPFQYLKLNGIELHMSEKGKAESVSFPYNPIELE